MAFFSEKFLLDHIYKIINFYYPKCIDKKYGGYINQFYDDGEIADYDTKHIVGTCRFIYNFSTCYNLFKNNDFAEAAKHGLKFLYNKHKRKDGSYIWVMDKDQISDKTRHCYGMAFVLLAYAIATKYKIEEEDNKNKIYETFNFLENYFFEKKFGMYVDVIDGDNFNTIDNYRGQNANMHLCEALLCCYEATRDTIFLKRAKNIANKICNDLSYKDNYVWEHYNENWEHDWEYNINDPKHLFRPYGFLPGHFFEWAKLLMNIYRHDNENWLIKKSEALFDISITNSWDKKNGGIFYTFDREKKILDTDKYYWVHSEMIAAAAGLHKLTNNTMYLEWYDRCWEYVTQNFSDEKYGGWYRVLNVKNEKYDNYKSPPAKTDYHPIAACSEALLYLNF